MVVDRCGAGKGLSSGAAVSNSLVDGVANPRTLPHLAILCTQVFLYILENVSKA